jgi:glycosyltransferase involved in cell wall biosynthesis
MKILFLPRWYPSKDDPMLGLFIKRHAEVASNIADVFVLAVIAGHNRFETELTTEGKVTTFYYYYPTKSTYFSIVNQGVNLFRWFCCLIKGLSYFKRTIGKVDLIHVNILTRLGVIAWIIKQFYGIPYVITEHWSRYINGGFKGVIRIYITRIIVSGAAKVSTVSLNLWVSMQQYGLKNPDFVLLPNVVDTKLFKCHNSDSIVSEQVSTTLNQLADYQQYNSKRFIHVSCFEDRSKNISGLLSVLFELQKVNHDFECLLVGDGIDDEKLKSYAASLGLKFPQVQFTGLLEGEKLVKAYCSASFMVMFSNYENIPVVIGEAFSCGLPVIATNSGGIAEYLTDWNGQLIPVGDEMALCSSILYLLNHIDEYDRQHIRQYSEQCFGIDKVEKQLGELYNINSKTFIIK